MKPERDASITPADCVEMFESEARAICGEAALRDDLETGGLLAGLDAPDGHPVILLATGPGINATHEPTRFAHDLDFFREMMVLLQSYGLYLRGTHHHHHSLGLHGPSGGDVSQVKSLARRNHLRTWCEIITSCHSGTHRETVASGYKRTEAALGSHRRTIGMNAFLYRDPQNGLLKQVPVRLIRGMSPIRIALLLNGKVTPADIAEHGMSFPRDHIIVDESSASEDHTDQFPPEIVAQLQGLPMEAQEGISVQFEDGKAVVTLPVIRGVLAHVTFGEKPPHDISAIHLEQEEDATMKDVTRHLPNVADMSLAEVYQAMRTLVQRAAIRAGSQNRRGESQNNWLR